MGSVYLQQFLFSIPSLLIFGFAVVQGLALRPRAKQAADLLVAGGALGLFNIIIQPLLLRIQMNGSLNGGHISMMGSFGMMVVRTGSTLLSAVAIGLIVAAAVTGRRTTPEETYLPYPGAIEPPHPDDSLSGRLQGERDRVRVPRPPEPPQV